jgi:hypothetical protein
VDKRKCELDYMTDLWVRRWSVAGQEGLLGEALWWRLRGVLDVSPHRNKIEEACDRLIWLKRQGLS